ncbi:MAG TPA: adenosylcobinamide-phosphate synthase CbiB [Gammaproteobacteria bacterium]|nr:adenosylcobinamide-phosphate synthase CbiB [Gammaproteobacteria bacterium]
MQTALVCLTAVLLDLWLGEPQRGHPLAGFGRWATRVEHRLHGSRFARSRGVLALLVLVVPPVAVAGLLVLIEPVALLVEVLLVYLAIGATSLIQHGRAVAMALQADDLPAARRSVQWMVSRDTADLDREGVAAAAVESQLENGNDAVFGALFWFVLLGAPGVVLFRLVNTLDAMWGYRNERYGGFGWAAARLDDVLGWIPARLTALTYLLLGEGRTAARCWWRQGGRAESPNAGPVIAAGAGSLGLQVGGDAVYAGEVRRRPLFGEGFMPGARDILRAGRLVQHGVWLWLGTLLAGGLLFV